MIGEIEGKKSDLISKWEEKSREFIDTFLMLFGRDGYVVIIFFIIFSSSCNHNHVM